MLQLEWTLTSLAGPPASNGGKRGCGRLSDHFAPLNPSILSHFSPPASLLFFPSSFSWALLMHVITKLAAVGGYSGILTPEMLPRYHLTLHHPISIFDAIVPELSSSLSTVTIISAWHPMCMCPNYRPPLSTPLSCIGKGWLCSVSLKKSWITGVDFKQVWQVSILIRSDTDSLSSCGSKTMRLIHNPTP